jgi:hypothetical protein
MQLNMPVHHPVKYGVMVEGYYLAMNQINYVPTFALLPYLKI